MRRARTTHVPTVASSENSHCQHWQEAHHSQDPGPGPSALRANPHMKLQLLDVTQRRHFDIN